MAKPTPELEPEEEAISVFTPMSLPSLSTRAPPELPGLMAASVWIMFVYTALELLEEELLEELSAEVVRLVAETMPVETDCSRPNGLPTAITHSPTERSEEEPISMAVRSVASIFNTARSLDASVPTTMAVYTEPEAFTLSWSAPSITW